ncbi:helix-turn-helix domain-containing protein [Cohnella luojiensis]|uniref:AraC family transcriptional regulator n=1 Tax=Cohnella luojiensis TaxID=652876 RepID=A0A4Y8M2E5_9BACL|nr:helix-turn-helix domain-containing protein [Cohnella luojiensis]TFE29442.1 AraC family transcriptional regulator [Cohnella luojiensis]
MSFRTLDDLLPTVNFASRATAMPGADWGVRLIPDCQLVYVVSGQAELTVGRHTYDIRAGECVYYDSEIPHRLLSVGTTDYYSVHFVWRQTSSLPVHPGHSIQYLDRQFLDGEPRYPEIEIPPYGEVTFPTKLTISGLEPILTKLVKEYELEQPGYTGILRALMLQALSIIFRQLLDKDSTHKSYGRIDPAIQAMQEQPGKNWAVSELAAMCGYHPIHFAKLFKEEIGLLPKHYIIGERIKRAKRALLQGEKVEAISERLGFTSIHYFSHQFKKLTGLTPTEFRMHGRPPN